MTKLASPVLKTVPLRMHWPTLDPFLFCAHHRDAYPAGDEKMGVTVPLTGRNVGSDFSGLNGFSMYHGDHVPGFPQHPHRGFETITLARSGYIDHSDSMGATARFGNGDLQWMTAGKGIVHAEMFPLVHQDQDNPAELFQIWLNLPAASKMVEPYFSMFWSDEIPRLKAPGFELIQYVGPLEGQAPAPPPDSWASNPQADIVVWRGLMEPGAKWTLPAGPGGVHRVLYFYQGDTLRVADGVLPVQHGAQLDPTQSVELEAGAEPVEWVLLQGRPIGEPVVQHGPFVMNSRLEIQQTMMEYRQTRFGGWPWDRDDPVHPREQGRFAIHADGRRETPKVG
ncbi:MAG: pirin family protein [Myxococcota bacterium]|nr:pirin family protein [Myxococcota bacterium]